MWALPSSSPLAQRRDSAPVNWALHNLDLAGTRYSPMDQINRSNVKSLVPRWLFQHGVIDGVSNQTTPIVVEEQSATTVVPPGYELEVDEHGNLLITEVD